MGIFDSIFGGYSADRKAKEEFTLKIKDAGKAYIIDSGTYISGPFIVDKPIKGTLYINKRGLFFQAIPATKCIVIYVEEILKIEAFKEKKKCIKVDYKSEEKSETLIMEALDAEGCVRELKKAIEEYRSEDREDLLLKKKQDGAAENQEDILNTIEKLSNLRDKGAITEEEFLVKKKELLSRL